LAPALGARKALSIRHTVYGCLEGVFAQGQVYVLVSRVTDPANFALVACAFFFVGREQSTPVPRRQARDSERAC
jgi:hypothetical protein